MKVRQLVLSMLAIWAFLHGVIYQLRARDTAPPLYLVLCRFTVGADGKLQSFQQEKTIDLFSGSNNAATVELPPSFLEHAKKQTQDDLSKSGSGDVKPAGALASFLYVPSDEGGSSSGTSFAMLNEVMNSTTNFRLLGQSAAAAFFGAKSGQSAFFVSYYAVSPLPKATSEERLAIVEAEVQRNAANMPDAAILSRKNLSTDSQTIIEVTCKSPRNKALTLRSRYICNDRQMLGFTAVTPDASSVADSQSVERLFEAFCFR